MPGVWHHITQRGNGRRDVFFDDADRALYLQLLRRYCARHDVKVTGYCLMTNHVHILAVPARETSLARAFGRAHNDYARWLNVKRGETGHCWQNRYFSCPLDEAHQWEALRYAELNPVRAGLVTTPGHWPWSSAAAHLGEVAPAEFLDLTEWLQRWSPTRWRDALSEGLTDAAFLERIREASRTGRPVGSDAFMRGAERLTGRRFRPSKRGPKPKVAVLAQAQLVIE